MPQRTDRLDFRMTTANRRLIERAARLLGMPLTAFAMQALLDRAEEVVANDTQRKVSARDWKRFVEILDSGEVAPALAKAARKYRTKSQ